MSKILLKSIYVVSLKLQHTPPYFFSHSFRHMRPSINDVTYFFEILTPPSPLWLILLNRLMETPLPLKRVTSIMDGPTDTVQYIHTYYLFYFICVQSVKNIQFDRRFDWKGHTAIYRCKLGQFLSTSSPAAAAAQSH